MRTPDWVVIAGLALYVFGGVFFAFGYGDTEPEYPKLSVWKAFSYGATWPVTYGPGRTRLQASGDEVGQV
jgi:hypothetical protein